MVTEPALMLLDEPTSGLDSYTSLAICQLLRTQAYRGQTIVATIHQPSAEIFMTFDKVYCLAEGYTVYCGPPEHCFSYMKQFGLNVPKNTNPADKMSIIAAQPRLILNDNITIKSLAKECEKQLKMNQHLDLGLRTNIVNDLSRRFTFIEE